MVDPGGISTEAFKAAYVKPFTAKTGIEVIIDSPSPLGKLRALVDSGRTDTALYVLGAAELQEAKALNLVQKLDWEKIAPLPIFPEAKDDYGIGTIFYSTLMAWRKGVKAPRNWADFFNTKEFPGTRTLPNNPVYVLPPVLLGCGIPMEKLYPLDVDRAFHQLETIKRQVAVWWMAGAQPPQLLRDNEVQYAIAFSGRVAEQADIEYSFNQASLDVSFLCVVKDTDGENLAAAYQLLYEVSVPQNEAVAFGISPYPGSSPELEMLLPKDKLAGLPTAAANRKVQYITNTSWWLENTNIVQKRWQEFILSL